MADVVDVFDTFRHKHMKLIRKVHKDMTIASSEWDENIEDVHKRSYEPKDDGLYKTAYREEREKLLNLLNN